MHAASVIQSAMAVGDDQILLFGRHCRLEGLQPDRLIVGTQQVPVFLTHIRVTGHTHTYYL